MRRIIVVAGVLVLAAWPHLAGAQGDPSVSITSPEDGDTVSGPMVTVTVDVENFELVEAATEAAEGEGHVHFFVDTDPVEAGEPITTGQENILHLGAEPFDSRELELEPGEHEITAVLANSSHVALDPLVSDSVTFTVEEGEDGMRPTRPADTGDGSLASDGPGWGLGLVIAMLIGIAAFVGRYVARRV